MLPLDFKTLNNILAGKFACENTASGNFSTFSMSENNVYMF